MCWFFFLRHVPNKYFMKYKVWSFQRQKIFNFGLKFLKWNFILNIFYDLMYRYLHILVFGNSCKHYFIYILLVDRMSNKAFHLHTGTWRLEGSFCFNKHLKEKFVKTSVWVKWWDFQMKRMHCKIYSLLAIYFLILRQERVRALDISLYKSLWF